MEATKEVQNRKPRDADSRALMGRPTAWAPPEALPSPYPRDGWKHRWIRISSMGNADPKNISSSFREGYEACKAEEYPELMMHETTEGRFKGNIEVGGLLLCRIPAEFLVQKAEYLAKKNEATMQAVDNNLMRESNPKMPIFKESSSRVTFGPGS